MWGSRLSFLRCVLAAVVFVGLSAPVARAQDAETKVAWRSQCETADQLNPNDQSGANRQNARAVAAACDRWLGVVIGTLRQTDTENLESLEALVDSMGYRDPTNSAYGRPAMNQALALEALNTVYFEAEAERVINPADARDLLKTAKKMAALAENGVVKKYRVMAKSGSVQIQEALDTW